MARTKYVTKDGYFYQKSNKRVIAYLIIGLLFFFGITFSVGTCSNKIDSTGRQLDIVREQLDRETETNRQLRAELESAQSRLEQCQFIVNELGESTGRDITTVRECIELVEEIRYEVACLSYYVSGGTSDDVYNRIDSWLESEGVEWQQDYH